MAEREGITKFLSFFFYWQIQAGSMLGRPSAVNNKATLRKYISFKLQLE
jgi:hypothetical protein